MSAGKPTLDALVQEIESVRGQLEREREITARILRLTSSSNDLHDLIREATLLLREWSGCDAVGIRLREGDDFPYFETQGFPPQFVLAENSLCVRDGNGQLARDFQGNVVLDCMCGNILCGRFDATLPFFTPGGSFWTNSTTELLASTTEADRQARTRNRCNGEGYESVALIPLRSGGFTLGLLQLNDQRRDRFTIKLIELLENLGHALAESIARHAAAKEIERRQELLLQERERLSASESRLRGLLDAVDQSVMLMDERGTIVECNPTFAARLGRTRKELLGTVVYGHIPTDIVDQRRQRVEDAARSRQPVSFVDERWGRRIAHRIVPIVDERGEVIQFAVQGVDITEQSRSIERLKRNNEILQAIQEVQALFIADREPHDVFRELLHILVRTTRSEYGFLDEVLIREDGAYSKRSLAITDIAWDDASRQLYQQLASRDFLFPNLDNLAGAPVTTGQTVMANAPHLDPRFRGLPPGHPPLHCFLGVPLRCGGELVGVVGVANREGGYDEALADFLAPLLAACAGIIAAYRVRQESQDAHRALAESEKHFQLLYERAPLSYQSLDAKGHVLEVNQAWLDLLGYARPEVIGKSFADFLVPTQRSRFEQRFRSFKELGEIHGAEFELIRKDGTQITISADGRVARDGTGTFLRTHCILNDITLRKQSELLLAIERDLAVALSSAQDMDDVVQRTLQAALDSTGLDCGGVYLIDATTNELSLACHRGVSPEFARDVAVVHLESEQARIIGRGQFIELDGERLRSATFEKVRREGMQAVLIAPVTHEGKTIACLSLGSRTANRITLQARNALEAITALMGVAMARARAAESLRQSQAELRAVYDNSPIMMCVLDNQRRLLYMNRTMSEFIGKTEEELRYQRACGIIGCINALEDPRGCGYGTNCQDCALRLALEDTLATGRSHTGIERNLTVAHRDGPQATMLLGATALIQTDAGFSLLVCLEDMTDRKIAEETLRLQAMVLDQIADRVTVTDLEGRITYVNDAQCLGFQRSREQLVGQSVNSFGDDPERGATQREIIEQTLRTGQWRGEVVNYPPEGGETILDCRTQLVRDGAGRPCAMCGIATDITRQWANEHRLADMQLQLHHTSRLAAMGELAAGIAHEVNQPLRSIVNFANACRNVARGESDEWKQIRTWSDAIASSAAHAGDIIRRMISFARLPQEDRKVVRVQQIFDDAILLVQHEARANRVTVRLVTSDPNLTVIAQPVPIHQVMVNLLRNSIDALGADSSPTPQVPRRQVVVQAARFAEDIAITVVDNGPGIPEAVLPKIFEPFYTTKPQGLGLGLVISRTIVEEHGGKIWATNNRDGGLTVHFTLPAGRD